MAERIAALSLVVPAYDEATRLPRTLAAASEALPSLAVTSEIIVVDDGSHDRTAEVARRFAGAVPVRVLSLPRNSGKGAAVAAGIEASSHALVAFTDADCPYDLESLRPMLAALTVGRIDVAIGARELPDSQVSHGYGALRFASGKVFSWLTWLAIGLPFRDSQCGLKAFRRDVARSLFAVRTVDRFGFDFELLAAAVANGLVVERFPVRLTHDDDSRIDLVRDSREMLRDLLRVRRNLRCGAYRFEAERGAVGASPAASRCPVCGGSAFSPRVARDGYRMVECAVCDLWYLNPIPSSATLERFYGEEYFANDRSCTGGYADYGAQADDLRATFRRRLALVGGVRENARLLDVGGGYGYLADAAAEDARFTERWVVEASREAASRVAPGHRTVVGWFPEVTLPDRIFDLVSLQDCLEHLPEPRRALERARELLRPEGRLLVTTPNTASLIARLQGRDWISIKLPEHVALYSPANLSRLLIDTGFGIDRIARAHQRVRLDFLATRLLAPWPRAGRRLAGWLRRVGLAEMCVWVPSGSITVVATRRERTATRAALDGASSSARPRERDDAAASVAVLPTRA